MKNNNPMKSPAKHVYSITKASKSLSPHHQKHSAHSVNAHSQSKVTPIKREIYYSQAYKTILSKLLSKNTIQQFVREASKFLTLTDDAVQPYLAGSGKAKKKNNEEDFPELGRAMLKDGSFIKHYCTLLVLEQPQQQKSIKGIFYNKYKEEITEKKGFFDKYFKEAIKEQQAAISEQKSQSQKKKVNSKREQPESFKKVVTAEKREENDKVKAVLFENSGCRPQLSQFSTPPALKAQQKEQFSSNSQKKAILSIKISSRKKLLEQGKSSRSKHSKILIGQDLVSPVEQDKVHNSKKSKKTDQLSTDREQQADLFESRKRTPNSSPLVLRNSYRSLQKQLAKKSLSILTTQKKERLSLFQRSLLEFYPRVDKFGYRQHVFKDSPQIMGNFEGKVVIKCWVTDLMQFGQPTYAAIYTEDIGPQNYHEDFKRVVDRDVQVFLVNEEANERAK